ncbi:hypothetical protein [Comamonas kerstersii]|uniref:portal protein n=1 Tax=Comamonas kerstersii TaxID=225992 RepID=UPI00345D1E49
MQSYHTSERSMPALLPKPDAPLSVTEWEEICREALNQQPWRAQSDKEADYANGNQLDSDLLRRQRAAGIPPAKENIIGPAIAAVCGYEKKTRTDWRVTPDGDPEGQDVADALNYKLNQAERHSKADRALSEAFRPAVTVGLGWVEVSRPSDPFEYPYRCRYVSRNEIWWDMKAREPDLKDARWLFRRRWVDKDQAAMLFPEHAELILRMQAGWASDLFNMELEGGQSTGLYAAADTERGWTLQEDSWYNTENRQVCISEVWYRRWVSVMVLKLRNGRVVELDESNAAHIAAVQSGVAQLQRAVVARMRRSYWIGPHRLADGPTPYPFKGFPYVPVWCYREDTTGVPFGLVRDMLFPQDSLNSTIAKLRWGMGAVRTERTKGAVDMTDDQFRRAIARPDADIVLNAQHMSLPGARFEVHRDFQLNAQQFQLMQDSRAAIERVTPITPSLRGQQGTARSGLQEQTQLEQSTTTLADPMDSFKEARALVGEMLMALIIEDTGREETTVVIEGDTINPPRTVVLNKPERDPVTGMLYLSNDIQRTRLKVALEDVPSSPGFRAQQLNALSEAVKALPAHAQQVMLPFLVDLMDTPRKKQVVETLRNAEQQADPEAIREQVKQELMHDLKLRELEIKERESDAKIKKLLQEAVQTGVQAAFSAMQAGAQVAQMPMIAPVADAIMQSAGYQKPNPGGDDPNFPTAQTQAAVQMKDPYLQGQGRPGEDGLPEVRENTSPAFPPVPQQPGTGMQGIETPEVEDNI